MDEAMIERAVEKALKKNLGEFFIDRERHYRHHAFLDEFITWTNECKRTATQTIAKLAVTALIALVIMGFILWGSTHLRGG
jgi:Fe2+ transport system protein B